VGGVKKRNLKKPPGHRNKGPFAAAESSNVERDKNKGQRLEGKEKFRGAGAQGKDRAKRMAGQPRFFQLRGHARATPSKKEHTTLAEAIKQGRGISGRQGTP